MMISILNNKTILLKIKIKKIVDKIPIIIETNSILFLNKNLKYMIMRLKGLIQKLNLCLDLKDLYQLDGCLYLIVLIL